MHWTYKKAHAAFNQPIRSDEALWKHACADGDPYRFLYEMRRQLPRERRNDLDVLAPMVATWLRWEYTQRQETTIWHHWFLEPEMTGAFMQASIEDLPVAKLQIPLDTGLRIFSHDHAGCYAEILIAPGGNEGEEDLLVESTVYEPSGRSRGTACVIPWRMVGSAGEAYEYAMKHVRTDDDASRVVLYEALVVGISAWLYFTSAEPDAVTLEDPDYARAARKVARLTGAVQKRAQRELGKKPAAFQVFRLRDLPQAPSGAPLASDVQRGSGDADAQTRAAHTVRAHWRWQACGPQWSQHKLVLVKPHRRGDEARGTLGYRFAGQGAV